MLQNYSGYKYKCDDCGNYGYYKNHTEARLNKWAIAKNYRNCYCPHCADKHRNTGRKGYKPNEQIKISI